MDIYDRNNLLYGGRSAPRVKVKNWWWNFTIFMNCRISNAIWPFGIFLARAYKRVEDLERDPRTRKTILHEEYHLEQQFKWYIRGHVFGLFAWYFCYVFILPFFFNPFRWRWEAEAYMKAQNYNAKEIEGILSGWTYGKLVPKWHRRFTPKPKG